MSTKVFRDYYRVPLARTRNRTIADYDRKSTAAKRLPHLFDSETGKAARAKADRWGGKTEADKKAAVAAMRRGLAAKVTPEQRVAYATKASRKFWASISPEEKARRITIMRAATPRHGAPWPFPFTKVRDRARAIEEFAKGARIGAAAAVKARRLKRFLKATSNPSSRARRAGSSKRSPRPA